MSFETDTNAGGIIKMHFPSAMFENVIDVLRNEKPIDVYFAQGLGYLDISSEPVGGNEENLTTKDRSREQSTYPLIGQAQLFTSVLIINI